MSGHILAVESSARTVNGRGAVGESVEVIGRRKIM
jgi:hypothetical protein